jgi:hypothetical protein
MASFLIRWLAVENAAGHINVIPGDAPTLASATATDTDQNGALSTIARQGRVGPVRKAPGHRGDLGGVTKRCRASTRR